MPVLSVTGVLWRMISILITSMINDDDEFEDHLNNYDQFEDDLKCL